MDDKAYIHYLDLKNESDVRTAEKLAFRKWGIWEETVINWLKTKILVINLLE